MLCLAKIFLKTDMIPRVVKAISGGLEAEQKGRVQREQKALRSEHATGKMRAAK